MPALEERVALTISDGRGGRWRLADDEPNVDNVPNDVTISSSLPGGAKEVSSELWRDPRIARRDVAPLNDLRVSGIGNRTLWRGYLSRGPQTVDRISPTAIGDAGRLTDTPGLRMIPVDRELGNWTGMPRARQLALRTAGLSNITDGVAVDDANGNAGLKLESSDNWAAGYLPNCEAFYDAGPGMLLDRIYGLPAKDALVQFFGANFSVAAYLADDDAASSLTSSGGLTHNVAFNFNVPAGKRFALLQQAYVTAGAGGIQGATYSTTFTNLAVYGKTGIPLDATPTGPPGVHGADVLKAILALAQCGISWTTDSIAPDDFVIPDLKWKTPVDASTMILDTNRFYQRNWIVRDRLLYWQENKDLGRLWRARRDEGTKPESSGFDADQIFNGVVVNYTDGSGSSLVVGPPSSGLTGPLGLSTASLEDTSDTNPATLAGRRKWLVIDAGLTTEDGAIRLGYYALRLLANRLTSGSVEIPNFAIFDESGARYPASEIGAGDRLLIVDEPNPVERLIVDANWSKTSRAASLALDAPPDDLAAILERLAVNLVGVVS